MLGFVDDHALILYVYLSNDDDGGDESVLTVSDDSIGDGTLEVCLLMGLVGSIISVPTVLDELMNGRRLTMEGIWLG